jgi:hypothetical protein
MAVALQRVKLFSINGTTYWDERTVKPYPYRWYAHLKLRAMPERILLEKSTFTPLVWYMNPISPPEEQTFPKTHAACTLLCDPFSYSQ